MTEADRTVEKTRSWPPRGEERENSAQRASALVNINVINVVKDTSQTVPHSQLLGSWEPLSDIIDRTVENSLTDTCRTPVNTPVGPRDLSAFKSSFCQ